MGLHRLQGTVRYPRRDSAQARSGELIGKLCAGNPHAQFERRCWERVALSDTAPAIDQWCVVKAAPFQRMRVRPGKRRSAR